MGRFPVFSLAHRGSIKVVSLALAVCELCFITVCFDLIVSL